MAETFTRAGGCRCGRIRFRVTLPAMLSMACHCGGCQRMTASAFSLSIAVQRDRFEITRGQEVVVKGGEQLDDEAGHRHCSFCKSWLFTEVPERLGFVNVRTTMLDDTSGLEPFIETQTAEKLPWATTPAKHSFERFPPMDEYLSLIQAYATRGPAQ
jgi:hypothetical protein